MSSEIRSDQSLSRVRLFATPWIAARQASLSITNSRSSLRLTSIDSVMPSSHLTLCRPLLLLTPIPPSIRVFSNESTLHMTWPKYWSFSFSIILPKKSQGWSASEWTGWISLQSKGLSFYVILCPFLMLIHTPLNLIIQCPCSPRKDRYEWTTPIEDSPSSVWFLCRDHHQKRASKLECSLLIKTDLFLQEKVHEMRFVSFHLCKCLQWNHILNIFRIFPYILKSEACHFLCEGSFSLFYKFHVRTVIVLFYWHKVSKPKSTRVVQSLLCALSCAKCLYTYFSVIAFSI